jgi:hypothetical protein
LTVYGRISAVFFDQGIGDVRFDCDPECIEFFQRKGVDTLIYRKAHHESPEEYIRQNTALAALHGWGKKINPVKK